MDIPLPFGLVSGRLYAAVGDTADVGRNPDLSGLSGTATFTGTIAREIVLGADPMVIVPQAIVATVTNGVLMWQSELDVPLTANLSPLGVSLGWQWKVAWALHTSDNKPVVLAGWNLDVKVYNPDATLDVNGNNPTITDITESAPVLPASSGVQLAKGDKGDPGPGIIFLGPGQAVPIGTPVPTLVVRLNQPL